MKNWFSRYLVLVIFIMITCIGLVIRYALGDESFLWNLWSVIDVSFAVALGMMAFLGYKEFISSEDEIKIYFQVDDQKIDTQITLLRKNFTRSELMGILGVIRKKKEPYDIAELSSRELLSKFHTIQKEREKEFILKLTQEELEQFSIE